MKRRLLSLYLLTQFFAFAVPALAVEPPVPTAPASPAPAEVAPAPPSTADLQQQLADAQDKLATALHSYTLLDDANSHLKAQFQPLQERARQLQDEVADLAAENARLRTRLALLAPLPGSPAPPSRAGNSP
jgi:small-conductance mechanosensitive channel